MLPVLLRTRSRSHHDGVPSRFTGLPTLAHAPFRQLLRDEFGKAPPRSARRGRLGGLSWVLDGGVDEADEAGEMQEGGVLRLDDAATKYVTSEARTALRGSAARLPQAWPHRPRTACPQIESSAADVFVGFLLRAPAAGPEPSAVADARWWRRA